MTRKEYNNCVNETADKLFSFCLKVSRHRQDAEDVVQMAYERLWNNRDKVDREFAQAWLFTVAHRLMIDQFRKDKRNAIILDINKADTLSIVQKNEVNDLLEQAFKGLGQLQKQLILLRDYEGYSYKEIAEIADLSMSQVKVYIFRARKALKQWIEKSENKTYETSYK